MRYAPDLKVWHHAWRSPDQMRKLYRDYAFGEGMFYAKHLLAGDLTMIRYMLADIRATLGAVIAALLHAQPRWWDSRLGRTSGLPLGLWRGLRTFGPRGRS
jgi:hypothetical protein